MSIVESRSLQSFHPSLTYIHLMVKKTKENEAKQTFSYVEHGFNVLLDHGIFDSHPRITLWSDGCGKHFKTYATQYFMAGVQERLRKRQTVHWVCFFTMLVVLVLVLVIYLLERKLGYLGAQSCSQ